MRRTPTTWDAPWRCWMKCARVPGSRTCAAGSGATSGGLCHLDLQTLRGHTGVVTSVSFSSDGSLLATASADATVRLWEVATGRAIRTLRGHRQGVLSVAFCPQAKLLATGGRDQTVRLWDTLTGREVRILRGPTDMVNDVAFSSDG